MIIEKENVINGRYCDHLAYTLGEEGKFPWYFVFDSAPGGHDHTDEVFPSFHHTLWYQGKPHSDQWPIFYPAVIEILDSFNVTVKELMRVRLGLITKSYKNVIHGPHVDWEGCPHKTILFYFNDSDGDTYFYKEFWQENVKPKTFILENSITPQKNKAVFFDGYQYHSSSTPINSNWRLVMNINFF